MKHNFFKWIFLISIVIIGCNQESQHIYTKPQSIIISGKVLNFDPEINEIKFAINRLGSSQENIKSKIDDSGYFVMKFDSYIPTDIWVEYKSNFLVLTNPGDSIYLEFDGGKESRHEILKTISFGGDTKKINQESSAFQQLFFSQRISHDIRNEKVKNLDYIQYVQFEDSLRQTNQKLFNEFATTKNLEDETKQWISIFIDDEYYYPLSFYPHLHRQANNLKKTDWDVPHNYYDFILDKSTIKNTDFISGYALASYVNYFGGYVYKKIILEQTQLYGELEMQKISEYAMDSIIVYGMIKYTPDRILQELVLSEYFNNCLNNSQPETIERFQHLIDKYLQEQFISIPLAQKYNEVKKRLINPKLSSDAILNELNETSIKDIIDTILQQNKGKVVLIDCWAIWCAPCLAEFPHSIKLMESMKNKDVGFVYLCIDSNEKAWKYKLSQFQLGGQHYFLNKEQSNELREIFKINGIPYYLLIGKSGTISEQGNHLRPSDNNTIEKIETLLKKKNVP